MAFKILLLKLSQLEKMNLKNILETIKSIHQLIKNLIISRELRQKINIYKIDICYHKELITLPKFN